MVDGTQITIVFMGFINQRSHHWGAPHCRMFIHNITGIYQQQLETTSMVGSLDQTSRRRIG